MSQYQRIFIVGHPGAGKGLFAKTLAEKLGWKFIDADLDLEARIGRSISEILGIEGERSFHDNGIEILVSQLAKEKIVVATDASIVCNAKSRELLSLEFVVFLKAKTQVQIERISRSQDPLCTQADLTALFDQLHHDRDCLYDQMSKLSINSENNGLEKQVQSVVNIILENEKIHGTANVRLDKSDVIFFHKKLHTPIHLSEQQAICLKLLAQGKTSKDIAREMHLSYRTIEGNIANTMYQLGCSSSKELIALYHNQP